ncbi:MAG: hypothetical protein OEN55_09645 [Alphaproteobacteria bacterium]|nr:hypothetical protein [Alphaproteobacteria bacterium]
MRRIGLFAVLTFLALGLAACPPRPPETVSWPDITFTHLQPIEFDVAEIRILAPYREPIDPPHVGEQFPVSPSRAARNWAEDRLRAVGKRGTVTITIQESSAVEELLEPSGGLKGLLTKEQSEKYLVVIAMEIKALDPVGPRAAKATARTRKSTTIREDVTLDEREEIWYTLTRDTMTTFDATMERQIRDTLGSFLK